MNNYNTPHRKSNSGRVWIGLFIVIIGFAMLTKTLGFIFYFPEWIFSWPMWLIIIGLIIGAKNNFRKNSAFILIFIGGYFLLERIVDADIDRFFWPVLIIALGAWLISGRNRSNRFHPFGPPEGDPKDPLADHTGPYGRPTANTEMDWDRRVNNDPVSSDESQANFAQGPADTSTGPHEAYKGSGSTYQTYPEDFIDTVSIFGQVKKNIYSKDFKGGDIVNIMGGADINLMQADIQHPIVLDVVQIFGGTTIIVPAHWKVHPEMTAVFGGVEDKRFLNNVAVDPQKNLIIKGTSIFGGITIKSI